jgi:hypothetical protein
VNDDVVDNFLAVPVPTASPELVQQAHDGELLMAGSFRDPVDGSSPHGIRAYFAKRITNASAVSAISHQPLSMTIPCPRLGISMISVTA